MPLISHGSEAKSNLHDWVITTLTDGIYNEYDFI
jgi:hypothetical protein